MGGTEGVAGVILVLGIVILLANLISPNSAWDDLQSAVQNTPSFDNPFDQPAVISGNATYLPDGPTDTPFLAGFYVATEFVGCENETYDRQNCINTDDADGSYFRFNLSAGSYEFSVVQLNLTPPGLMSLDAAELAAVRSVTTTVSCRTVGTSSIAPLLGVDVGGGGAGDVIGFPLSTCAVERDGFNRIIFTSHYPTGINDLDPNSGFELSVSGQNSMDDPQNATVDVSFVRVDLTFGSDVVCTAPDGAWLPALDEIACSIGQSLGVVWKGIQFFINGAIFLGEIGAYVGGIGVAVGGMVAVLFNLGAPSPFQELIDIMVVVLLVIVILYVVSTVRGSGAGV